MKMSMRPLVETPARVPNADLIFVLAGLEARKAFGLRIGNSRHESFSVSADSKSGNCRD